MRRKPPEGCKDLYEFIKKVGTPKPSAERRAPKLRTRRFIRLRRIRWCVLLRTQGEFAQEMFVQFPVSVGRLLQWKRARDVDFKRT